MAQTNIAFLEKKIRNGLDNLQTAKAVLWPILDHSKTDFTSNDTIEYQRTSVVPIFNYRQTGAAQTSPTQTIGTSWEGMSNTAATGGYPNGYAGPKGRWTQEGIYSTSDDPTNGVHEVNTNTHWGMASWQNVRSFVPRTRFTKTVKVSLYWSAAFEPEEVMFTTNGGKIIGEFMKKQMSDVIIPFYDSYAAQTIVNAVPTANKINFQADATGANLYNTFTTLNDAIKNAMYTDPSGLNLPLVGSGKKIMIVSPEFLTRLIKDIPEIGAMSTESQYKNLVNGWSGKLLGWDLIECHDYYMPIVTDASGVKHKCQALAIDPDIIKAPILLDSITKDDSRTVGPQSYINARHFLDCFIINDDGRPAGYKDNEQLLGCIYFTGANYPVVTSLQGASYLVDQVLGQTGNLQGVDLDNGYEPAQHVDDGLPEV